MEKKAKFASTYIKKKFNSEIMSKNMQKLLQIKYAPI